MKIDISEFYSDDVLIILDMDSLAHLDYVSEFRASIVNRPMFTFKLGEKDINSTVLFPSLKRVVDSMYYTDRSDFLFSFDTSPNALRHIYKESFEEVFSGYSERYNQLVALRNVYKKSSFKVLEREGVDSFSLINKAIQDNAKYYDKIIVFTKDKMLYSLVSEKVSLILAGSKFDLTYENYSQHLKVPYKLFNYQLIMLGDTTLKLEGIKGIGKKTFEKMIEEYDENKSMLENIQTTKYLKTDSQRELATQYYHWLQPSDVNWLDSMPTKPNLSRFKDFLNIFECQSLVEKI